MPRGRDGKGSQRSPLPPRLRSASDGILLGLSREKKTRSFLPSEVWDPMRSLGSDDKILIWTFLGGSEESDS